MPSTATTHELATLSNAGDSMYIILSGRVKVYASDDTGKNAILDIFGPGEQVGERGLDGGPRPALVVMLEPSTCAVYPLSRLIKRPRNAGNNIKTLARMDVYSRVARLLLSLVDDIEGKPVVHDKLARQDIADRVGASRAGNVPAAVSRPPSAHVRRRCMPALPRGERCRCGTERAIAGKTGILHFVKRGCIA